MKNESLFNRTIGILAKAYMNGTLRYVYCTACAVGNLVAAANDIKLVKNEFDEIQCIGGDSGSWICLIDFGRGVSTDNYSYFQDEIEKCEKTGYSISELALIEERFYKARYAERPWNCISNDPNFNGLMGIVDLLSGIHCATEIECSEAKGVFVR
jgi:hypothetical protein